MNEELVKQHLKQQLSPSLYKHCAGTAQTAGKLAAALNYDQEKARLAGWLHDCAREWSAEKLLDFAQTNGIKIDKFARSAPVILHGPIAAVLAKQWGINDPDVLSAVARHTLGAPHMTTLEQIVYLADKIEPNRCYPGVEELRQLAEKDFFSALIAAAAQTITFVLAKRRLVHPLTISYWNWLVEISKQGV
ncbi:MAG: HD domain-containing protein [Firmicutes bacterium]|nr:HD domain-containing protein [Bacillota bacterium]